MKQKKITHWLSVIVIGIALGFALQFVRAWTEPSEVPPDGNIGAPINTGSNTQTKRGSLGVDMLKLGIKFLFSGVGDNYANDNWLRLTDISGNFGPGFAASSIYANSINLNGDQRSAWPGGIHLNCFWSPDNQCSSYPGYLVSGIYINASFTDAVGGHYAVQCCRI